MTINHLHQLLTCICNVSDDRLKKYYISTSDSSFITSLPLFLHCVQKCARLSSEDDVFEAISSQSRLMSVCHCEYWPLVSKMGEDSSQETVRQSGWGLGKSGGLASLAPWQQTRTYMCVTRLKCCIRLSRHTDDMYFTWQCNSPAKKCIIHMPDLDSSPYSCSLN